MSPTQEGLLVCVILYITKYFCFMCRIRSPAWDRVGCGATRVDVSGSLSKSTALSEIVLPLCCTGIRMLTLLKCALFVYHCIRVSHNFLWNYRGTDGVWKAFFSLISFFNLQFANRYSGGSYPCNFRWWRCPHGSHLHKIHVRNTTMMYFWVGCWDRKW